VSEGKTTGSANGKENNGPCAIVVVGKGRRRSLSFGPILISAQLEQQIPIRK